MKKLQKQFKEFYQETLIAFLWRQWTLLGAAGHSEDDELRVIDPEALMIFSATVCRSEPRIFDEIIDWLVINGRFINIQRLKTLLQAEDKVTRRILGAICKFLRLESRDPKWEKLSLLLEDDFAEKPFKKTKLSPLFLQASGEPMPVFGKPQETFADFGFHRGALEIRRHSKSFPAHISNALLLKLRSVFGICARCEIIAYLLTHSEAHPGIIARETSYYTKTIQDALIEMTYSGLVQVRPVGREKHYSLKKELWSSFLGPGSRNLRWVHWTPLFKALRAISAGLNYPASLSRTSLLLSSHVRQLMLAVRNDLQEAGFGECLSDPFHYPGEKYLEVFHADTRRILDLLQG